MPSADPSKPHRMPRHLAYRVVRFVLVAVILAELTYVVAVNAFLNLGGVQKLLESTDDFRVTFRRAWTLWPGTVHVQNVRVLFQDHNLEWSIDMPSVHVELAFSGLFSKTLHGTRVRGEGTVFRARQRVDAADRALPTTLALPPIPEFETPALVPAYVPAAPRTDLWKIHLEDVDVSVVEIWTQQFRYLGNARARGAFRLHAGHHLWVGPASLDLEPGRLLAAGHLLSTRISGHVDCVVHPFFVNVPVGREVLRHFSANILLRAQDVRLAPLDMFLPQGTKLGSPGARLELFLAADHGVLTRQSRIGLSGPELRGRHADWVFDSGGFDLGFRIAPDGLGEATFRVESARVSRNGNTQSRLKLGVGSAVLATSSIDTSADWGLARMQVALARLELPTLAGFDDLAKKAGVRLERGSASLDATGRYSGNAISGEGRAQLSKAVGRVRSVGWELDGSAELSLGRVTAEGLDADSMDLAIQARRLALSAAATRVEARDAEVTARARLTRGVGSARIRSSAQRLSMKRGRLTVSATASADVDIPDIDLPRRTLRASTIAELASLQARAGGSWGGRARRVGIESELSLAKRKLSRGRLEVSVPSFSLHGGDTTVAAAAHLSAKAKELDLDGGRGTASSRLVVSNLSATDAVDREKCEWLSTPRAWLRSQLAFSPDGRARVSFTGEMEKGRAFWDDFEVAGVARLNALYRERSAKLISVDLSAKNVRMKSGKSELEGWAAEIPELGVVSTLRRDAGRLSGPVRVRAKHVEARIGRTPMHADVGADWRLALLDLERGEAVGSGNVRIDHAGLDTGNVRVEQWWGRLEIPLLGLGVGENLDMSGNFRGRFRDGVPALALVAASGDVPSWVPDLLPLHELEASGRFRRSCRTTEIVVEHASGGPLVAAGRIQSVPRDTRSAFLIQLQSPLAVSVGLVAYDDETGVSLFAGNDWLAEQSETLDRWALAESCASPPDRCDAERTEAPSTSSVP